MLPAFLFIYFFTLASISPSGGKEGKFFQYTVNECPTKDGLVDSVLTLLFRLFFLFVPFFENEFS